MYAKEFKKVKVQNELILTALKQMYTKKLFNNFSRTKALIQMSTLDTDKQNSTCHGTLVYAEESSGVNPDTELRSGNPAECYSELEVE